MTTKKKWIGCHDCLGLPPPPAPLTDRCPCPFRVFPAVS
jgi:hypothetical protein